MTTCDHQVKFHVKQLVARMPEYKCKHCGATVMMGKRLKNAIQAINVVFIIIMIAAAISSSILGPGMVGFVYYLILMAGILSLYLIINAVMITKGKFIDLIRRELQTDSNTADPHKPTISTPADTSGYTKEQLELMALYDSYVKKNEEQAGQTAEEPKFTVNNTPPVKTSQASSRNSSKAVKDTCEHVPATTWRTFLPGNNDFICSKCEQVITFDEDRKRILNIILLLFSIVAFTASISYKSIEFWQLALIALGILIVCSAIQVIFVKKSKFVVKKDSKPF